MAMQHSAKGVFPYDRLLTLLHRTNYPFPIVEEKVAGCPIDQSFPAT
jgi:hypothetical protein